MLINMYYLKPGPHSIFWIDVTTQVRMWCSYWISHTSPYAQLFDIKVPYTSCTKNN